MNGGAASLSGDATIATTTTTKTTLITNGTVKQRRVYQAEPANGVKVMAKKPLYYSQASFMKWTVDDAVHVATHHWMPCLFALGLLFFMAVEYTLLMVPPSSPPFDLGFYATRSLHRVLQASPNLNTLLAFLNTVTSFFSTLFRSEKCRFFDFWVFFCGQLKDRMCLQ